MQEEEYELLKQKTGAAARTLHEVLEFNNVPGMIRVGASVELLVQFLYKMGVPLETRDAITYSIAKAIRAAEEPKETGH